MSIWLMRAGKHGEYELRFHQDKRIYLTWEELSDQTMKDTADYEDIKEMMAKVYPHMGKRKLGLHSGQIWAFRLAMKVGDWVVVPYKHKSAVAIGEIVSDMKYDPKAKPDYNHYRDIKWLADVPRANFGQDLLYSFGGLLTIFAIKRNDAEKRIRAMARNGWKDPLLGGGGGVPVVDGGEGGERETIDLEQVARDAIAKLIMARFKGHGLARLVDAVLRAQGYHTYVSAAGADKGVDILAAPEPLGFGQPKICVQVKSEQGEVDRPTLDQLIGTMQNFHADQGILVAWGGFKNSVEREIPAQFFKVRMWDQEDLIDEILQHYDKLDAEVRAELPLKRIWTVTTEDDEEA